jgi:SNF2 family DNA or RNA helicase
MAGLKLKPGIKLMKHQISGVQFKLKSPIGADFSEVGTGKTASTVIALEYRHAVKGDSNRILWVTTNTIKEETAREVEKFSHFKPIVLSQRSSAARVSALRKLEAKKKFFVIVNYDSLQHIQNQLIRMKFDSIVCDESSAIKNPKANRTLALYKIAKALPAKFRWIMTGTPVPNNVIDVYGQWEFVEPGLFENLNDFKEKYCIYGLDGVFPTIIGYKDLDKLRDLLAKRSIRNLRSSCIELPERTFIRRSVKMLKRQAKAYSDLKEAFIYEENDKSISIKCILEQFTKLAQVTSGFIYDTENDDTIHLDNGKLLELKHVIQECNLRETKAIIWCYFRQSIKFLEQELSEYCPVTLFGETKNRTKVLDTFRNDDSCRLLIANIATSEGYTVNVATYSIYYEHDFSFKNRDQSLGRNYRKGQKEKVTVIDLVCSNTIDVTKLRALKNKKKVQDVLTGDDIKAKIKEAIDGIL